MLEKREDQDQHPDPDPKLIISHPDHRDQIITDSGRSGSGILVLTQELPKVTVKQRSHKVTQLSNTIIACEDSY